MSKLLKGHYFWPSYHPPELPPKLRFLSPSSQFLFVLPREPAYIKVFFLFMAQLHGGVFSLWSQMRCFSPALLWWCDLEWVLNPTIFWLLFDPSLSPDIPLAACLVLSWHSQLKQKADLIHTSANICEPRAQTCLLTDTRDRNCCDPVGVIVMGRSVYFKDHTISCTDGSVRTTAPGWRMALYCVAGCRLTPSHTQKQSPASVGSAGVTDRQRRVVASLGHSWTSDSVAIHLLVVSQKRRAARTASVTNNTCLHTSHCCVQGPQDAETQQHNRSRQVK